MSKIQMVDVDDIESILEATRVVASIINDSQGLIDGIPNVRLRHLGMALKYAATGDLDKTKGQIKTALRAE